MKDAYYFSHDSNARHDPKLAAIRHKYGWCGYGLYWAIVECLRDQPNYGYPNGVLYSLALAIGYDRNDPLNDHIKLDDFINYCIELGLFKVVEGMLISTSLINRMKALNAYRERLSEAGKVGAERRWGSQRGAIIGSDATPIAVKYSKVKKSKDINTAVGKNTHLEYVLLTDQEYKKLVTDLGQPAADRLIKNLNDYIGSKGVKYKSHYHTIRMWHSRETPTHQPKEKLL